MSVGGHLLPTGHALTSRDVRNCSRAELSWCCGKSPTERVGETRGAIPATPFEPDSLLIEATFLPDHAGKEFDLKGVLRRRLL
jgi:hypothetical protein